MFDIRMTLQILFGVCMFEITVVLRWFCQSHRESEYVISLVLEKEIRY